MIHLIAGKLKRIAINTILLFSALGIAQEINFGAKAGFNISSLRGDYPNGIEKKAKVGFHIGSLAEYVVNEKIGVQPELLFSRQGVTSKTNNEGFRLTQTTLLNYLNLALIGKYVVLEKLSIEFGPQFGYVLTAKSKWEYVDNTDSSRNETLEFDLINDQTFTFLGETFMGEGGINRFDFGLSLGAAYALNEHVFVQVRYTLGLLTVDEISTFNQSNESWKLKNSVLQFSVGYQF
ncbi:PorT family protein [Aggregatimonas sangjinii]|uniref:PorT family protein n=1 Tax=Aggregatimonas sangjinii TaxID=2583587 RepID=A0A5B7ST24_9FLAO|nr:porin family protein [Aggregatimonas sangjinii]QCX00479.1 PorT family protein [Aggregatimonas sangjinii]